MKKYLMIIFSAIKMIVFSGCGDSGIPADTEPDMTAAQVSSDENMQVQSSSAAETDLRTEASSETAARVQTDNNIEISVGGKVFSVTLYDNETAEALSDMLPLTLDMSELNKNEKYYYFDRTFPAEASCPKSINSGDIMLYGDNCLVLFYQSFQTSYSYTPIGRVDDPSGLKEAVGEDNILVTFDIK